MKYYKAFYPDLTCRDMQYEIGKEYTFDGKPIPCMQGFHFCKSIADCYNFYPMDENTRICEVEPLGEIVTDDEVKFCTNKIRIVAEIENPREYSNMSSSSSGFCNSGFCNSGDCNSGDCNSGNRNSGNRNSGDWNSGNRNSGDWNSGNRNSGVFNTQRKPTIKMFDKESDWTYETWYNSIAYDVMCRCPYTYSEFILASDMSDEEKEKHPEHTTIGGYIKTNVVTVEDKQAWWDDLSESDKQVVMGLPNFDADKFKECTEIDVGGVKHGQETDRQ